MRSYELVGLSGKSGAGKDWVAVHYFEPVGYRRLSFAWLLKWVVVAQGHATVEEVFETKPPHVRHLLQQTGTEVWRQLYGSDCWVRGFDAVARTLAAYHPGPARFVVTDVRFPNEVEAVRSLGGQVGRVVAPTRVLNNGLSDEARSHASETALDHLPDSAFDFVIHNDPGQSITLPPHVSVGGMGV